jgi:hypothetical protein
MSFHGGFLGAILALVLFARRRGLNPLAILDMAAVVTPIGSSSDASPTSSTGLWGRPAPDFPYAVVFPMQGRATPPEPALRSFGEGLVLFIVMPGRCGRFGFPQAGPHRWLFVFGYAVARIVCEFFREPDAHLGFLFGGVVTMGMLLSIPMALVGAFAMWLAASGYTPAKDGNRARREAACRRAAGADRPRGPLTVERYMGLCLQRYYGSRDPLGRTGDFTTAPEISQMFGELLGLWAAARHLADHGMPRSFRLVELGPGRGTLMSDALRATARVPGFREAASVHLVETSLALRERQPRCWRELGPQPPGTAPSTRFPPGPAIVIANEFFDALPVRQFVRTERAGASALSVSQGPAHLRPRR